MNINKNKKQAQVTLGKEVGAELLSYEILLKRGRTNIRTFGTQNPVLKLSPTFNSRLWKQALVFLLREMRAPGSSATFFA